jgi:hypothetical protein
MKGQTVLDKTSHVFSWRTGENLIEWQGKHRNIFLLESFHGPD